MSNLFNYGFRNIWDTWGIGDLTTPWAQNSKNAAARKKDNMKIGADENFNKLVRAEKKNFPGLNLDTLKVTIIYYEKKEKGKSPKIKEISFEGDELKKVYDPRKKMTIGQVAGEKDEQIKYGLLINKKSQFEISVGVTSPIGDNTFGPIGIGLGFKATHGVKRIKDKIVEEKINGEKVKTQKYKYVKPWQHNFSAVGGFWSAGLDNAGEAYKYGKFNYAGARTWYPVQNLEIKAFWSVGLTYAPSMGEEEYIFDSDYAGGGLLQYNFNIDNEKKLSLLAGAAIGGNTIWGYDLNATSPFNFLTQANYRQKLDKNSYAEGYVGATYHGHATYWGNNVMSDNTILGSRRNTLRLGVGYGTENLAFTGIPLRTHLNLKDIYYTQTPLRTSTFEAHLEGWDYNNRYTPFVTYHYNFMKELQGISTGAKIRF